MASSIEGSYQIVINSLNECNSLILALLISDGLNFISTKVSNQELSGAKSELQVGTVGVCSSYKRVGQPSYNCALQNMQMCLLPNQELSVLYGRPTLNYEGQLSVYVPHMLRVNMTRSRFGTPAIV